MAGHPSAPPGDLVALYMAAGDRLIAEEDLEGAITEYRKVLASLSLSQKAERTDVYLRMANIRSRQGRRREAIANFEKALQLTPEHRPALKALLDLSVADRDWRSVHAAEERFLSFVEGDAARFDHLLRFAARWNNVAGDPVRARATYERARELRPDDLHVLGHLRRIYEAQGATAEALSIRRRIAELTTDAREQAVAYFELGRHYLSDLKREDLGLELLSLALDSDPTLLEPLAIIAEVLAERQEWGELERAYRRMLDRSEHMPRGPVRREVRWELYRRLALLFRDYLEDPASALDAFEEAVREKPEELAGRLMAAELARAANRPERAAAHLKAAAVLDPANARVFHDLFDVLQKLRRPDEAWAAASVTVDLGVAEAREHFVYEEHRPDGVPRFTRPLSERGWDRLRAADRDRNVEAVLAAAQEAAIAARLAQRAGDKKFAQLDQRARQDLQESTIGVVRSFAWASHFLGVPAPAIYLRDDAPLGIAAITVEEPSVIVGSGVLRGRSLPDLAFLVGSHLTYHVGPHRLLLHFPSIEELGACFLASARLVRPSVPIPAALEDAALALSPLIDVLLSDDERDRLDQAVRAFEDAGARADLAHWAGAVERCAARAGYLLCGDLPLAADLLRGEPIGLLQAEEKIGDLYGFAVSSELHLLREELGVAIEP